MTAAYPQVAADLAKFAAAKAEADKLIFHVGDRVTLSRPGLPPWPATVAFDSDLKNILFLQIDGDTPMNWRGWDTNAWLIEHIVEVP
jgi:hypothetical protein